MGKAAWVLDMTDRKPHIVALGLTAREFNVLEELARTKELSHERILVQGLRPFQLADAGKVTIKDDGQPKSKPHEERTNCQECVVECTEDLYIVRGVTLCPKCARTEMGEQVFECSGFHQRKDYMREPPEERAKLRPANYAALSPEEQWAIDTHLDWVGQPEVPHQPPKSEPHRVSAKRRWHPYYWRWIRRVRFEDFRRLCSSCGRTGQTHKCPVKHFVEPDKSLAISSLRRVLPCRDLNGDWLRRPALRRPTMVHEPRPHGVLSVAEFPAGSRVSPWCLFTYRDLRRWLENPFGTPPLVPLAEQLSLDLT
jgi:hypothetical protein